MTVNDSYFGSYQDIDTHKMMLQDVVRTEAYERALRQAVTPGCRVLDFGCGTGILSIFASRFGAGQVYAVDQSHFIERAQAVAKCNQIDNIQFHHNSHKDLEIDTKVDILVSEWMGTFIFSEAMLGPLLQVRDRFLAKGGIMIPGEISLHVGLVTDDSFYEDLSFLKLNPYGIDFGPIANDPYHQTEVESVLPNQIMATTVDMGHLDMHSIQAPPSELSGKVVPDREATIYGLCGWFSAQVAPGINLGTGPHNSPTHWDQVYFSLDEPFEVSPQNELTVRIVLPDEDDNDEGSWSWSISDGQHSIKMNDRDHRQRLNPALPKGLLKDH